MLQKPQKPKRAPELDPFPKRHVEPDEAGQWPLFLAPPTFILTPGQKQREDAKHAAPSISPGAPRLSTARLFDDVPAPLSPSQEARQAARRALWKARQKRHRARRKMALRAEVAKYTGLEEQNAAAQQNRAVQTIAQHGLTVEQVLEYHRALDVLWGALVINRELAARVFEQLEAEWLTPERGLVFEAARRIHERGFPVTRAGIERELKKSGVLLLRPLEWLDDVFRSPFFPADIALEKIDESARIVKRA